ncbi:unnamed protein product [Auanema sp. JU1783]|nr:unnamed protein product [Auanema sp. JU1783]
MSSTRRKLKYGINGRACTSPALLSTSIKWQRPDTDSQLSRLAYQASRGIPPDPAHSTSKRNDVPKLSILQRPSSLKQVVETKNLVQKYVADSKDRLDRWAQRNSSSITSLLKKCVSPTTTSTAVNKYEPKAELDVTYSRPAGATYGVKTRDEDKKNDILKPRLSGSDIRIKWDVNCSEKKPTGKTSYISQGSIVLRMPVAGTSSRSGRLARISQSNIRPYGSGNQAPSTHSGIGGQPLPGVDVTPGAGSKKEFRHRFEIVKKLGSGTYGKVSLAFDHKFEREVAVKLIKKSAIENKEDLVRIRREIRIMSALNHPNIIQIFEVFENRDKIILVMEYACGGELYDYVSKSGSLPEPEARRIFRQITSAVLYCHKHKVAHRDLKLENILLDQDNNAKIADFGLSNYFSDKSLLSTFCGSPLYASPEIINGTPYHGPEVDCWSLGILLYTLVYGSMPFEGRDFNRMVRQIKRGAYYEPDTPSTASMLIRNMLRVNPERRANIFDIASHWWLNLEENMPVIQELPENQIIDHTPLTERAETMIVQDLADETDVFMEFGHLSNETRHKIEEFRRRRKEAEHYIDNSPVKPPKARKTDGDAEVPEMRTEEKSLRGYTEKEKEKEINDPLERLRQIENRLGRSTQPTPVKTAPQKPAAKVEQVPEPPRQPSVKKTVEVVKPTPEQPEDPVTARTDGQGNESRAPSFVPVSATASPPPYRRMSASTYRIETDSLNMLMNQVLEQMDKGPVSLNLVARIKAHPLYDSRPMVKELLESIIAAQPPAVQRHASKIIEQQSQDGVRKTSVGNSTGTLPKKDTKNQQAPTSQRRSEATKKAMGERPWHSVEVGFEQDDESELEDAMVQSVRSTATEVTVQDTSFEDSDDQTQPLESPKTPIVNVEVRETQTQTIDEADSEDEDEEYTDSEMEDLADEVDKKEPCAVPVVGEFLETLPPPDPATNVPPLSVSPQYLDAFDRGLIKRQSKGKYQHSRVDMYGRGVSTDCESPTLTRKHMGGPQPTPEQSPFLFDTAKKLIMQYPTHPDPRLIENELRVRRKKDLLKVDGGDSLMNSSRSMTPTSHVGSVPPRSPPPLKSDSEDEEDEDEEEEEIDESEEESEEEEEEVVVRRPRAPIINAVRRDGDKIETTTAVLNGRRSSYMQSAPASIHASMSPEPVRAVTPQTASNANSNAKYFVTVAELKVKPSANAATEPKPYSRVNKQGVNGTKTTTDKKSTESQLKEELKNAPVTGTTQPLKASTPVNQLQNGQPSSQSPEGGKEAWESAAAYIRRKNRERRIRNLTIAAPEEISRATERLNVNSGESSPGYHGVPSTAGDQFYTHHTSTSGASSLLNYIRPRYHDDVYRRRGIDSDDRSVSPNRYNTAAVSREERRSSYNNMHELSPDRPDYRSSAYGVGDTRSYYTSNASPSYTRKFENELQSSSLQTWAAEPRKFEVYKTRAERDREMHTMHTTPTAASSYRPTSYYSGSDRPLTTYGYRSQDVRNDYREPYRSTKYDGDNYGYHRRSVYDYDNRAVTPGVDTSSIPYSSEQTSGYRPAARRVTSALTDADKRAYNHRSRSMDRKQVSKDHDYSAQLRHRLMTPEAASGSDFSYVNYHDSSNGRASQGRDDKSGAPRGILKTRQSSEQDARSSVDALAPTTGGTNTSNSGNGRGLDGGTGPVRSVIDRLRRHLSLEKSSSPQRQQPAQTQAPQTLTTLGQVNGVRAPSAGANPKDLQGLHNGSSRDESPKKKRSLLSFNRRRTSEVRLGADGKLITNGVDDQYKRPSSPIDKIKSLFRKGDGATQDPYFSSRYVAGSDKSYGYPTSNVASTRDPYVPQYRKFPGSTPRDTNAALNRYSYTPGLTEQRRHWFDDHNMY